MVRIDDWCVFCEGVVMGGNWRLPLHSPSPVNQVSSCSTVLFVAESICSDSLTLWAGKCSFPSLCGWTFFSFVFVFVFCYHKMDSCSHCYILFTIWLVFFSILVWLRVLRVISTTWCLSSASGIFCLKVCRFHLHSDWLNNRLTDWQGSYWYM